jgi:hypothetical protein
MEIKERKEIKNGKGNKDGRIYEQKRVKMTKVFLE